MNDCRRRRKRLSPWERAGVLEEYHASGLTQRDFAARAGVSLGTLGLWLRSARKPRTDAPAPPVSFAPVALKLENDPASRQAGSRVEVELPGGMVVRLPEGMAHGEVARLVSELLRAC